MIGYAFCGSFCTHSRSLDVLKKLKNKGYDLQPIFSEHAWQTDTRFHAAEAFAREVEAVCEHPILHTIPETEPLGPRTPLEALIVAPCTGNTLAKLAAGITDTAVTMAVKAHLREDRPTVIALATNDALSQNLKSIATLLCRKRVYFVPLKQDDPRHKPHSLVAEFERIPEALEAAMLDRQLRPLFV